jgi:epoxyqueuosine reductase
MGPPPEPAAPLEPRLASWREPEAGPALVAQLRQRGRDAGLAAVGIAPAVPMAEARLALEERKAAGLDGGMQFTYRNPARSTDPSRVLAAAAALVVGAWWYGDERPVSVGAAAGAGVRPQGHVARYAWRDHYTDLRTALGQLADLLREAGWAARVVVDDNALVDRAAATRAGLGWYGKNSNVLLPERGSWFVLGSVVTDAPLPPDSAVGDGCGPCRRCLGACPTGALVAPGVLDARRCLAWLLQAPGVFPFEHRAALGGRIYGCDDCQDVCPPNRVTVRATRRPGRGQEGETGRAGEGQGETRTGGRSRGESERAAARHDAPQSEVDLLDMLTATDAWLLDRYGRWYIPQRHPRYLRRNALVALANTGDGHSPLVESTMKRYLTSPDELLRAHAVWAVLRLDRGDLLDGDLSDGYLSDGAGYLADDPSALVRAELGRRSDVVPAGPAQRSPAAGPVDPGAPGPVEHGPSAKSGPVAART